jgi:hypothetical protein
VSDLELIEQPAAETLRCVECAATTADGHDWRAYLTTDDDVAVYCPECAGREFGQGRTELALLGACVDVGVVARWHYPREPLEAWPVSWNASRVEQKGA